jgi:hypothetical protein
MNPVRPFMRRDPFVVTAEHVGRGRKQREVVGAEWLGLVRDCQLRVRIEPGPPRDGVAPPIERGFRLTFDRARRSSPP